MTRWESGPKQEKTTVAQQSKKKKKQKWILQIKVYTLLQQCSSSGYKANQVICGCELEKCSNYSLYVHWDMDTLSQLLRPKVSLL